MIVDYRIYCTAYALLALAWTGLLPLIARAEPGAADFREKMDLVDKVMRTVLMIAAGVGALNYFDWLWS